MWKFFRDKAPKNNMFALSFIVSLMVIMLSGTFLSANSQTLEVTPGVSNQTLTNGGNSALETSAAALISQTSGEIKTAATIEAVLNQSVSQLNSGEANVLSQASKEITTQAVQKELKTLENSINEIKNLSNAITAETSVNQAAAPQSNDTKEVKVVSSVNGNNSKSIAEKNGKKSEAEAQGFFQFRNERLTILVALIILALIVLISINIAASGKDYFIRRIGGLNAIDEAIGRCTEMGKPVLYITGLSDMSAISTIASISILSYVAKKTAEYETSLLVPCCRSLVMNTAREVVKESYLGAGRPDSYNAENIKYLTDDQFGFVSGVDGIMLREKPAANFYLGHFMAESLIYAETGNSIGAIQIAGTSEFSQIPFFVAACDYCLIGEELFAAGAYLSRKPKDVGTLRGQDICKLAIMATIIIGVIIETMIAQNPQLSSSIGFFKQLFISK